MHLKPDPAAASGRRGAAGRLSSVMPAIITLLILTLAVPGYCEEPTEAEFPKHCLFIMNADGSNLRPLANLADYTGMGSPEWSSDGKRIVLDAWRDGEAYSASHVVAVDVDGSSRKDLGPGAMPSWSPRGGRIAFCQYAPDRGVWVMNSDGSDFEQLDPAGWGAAWSPDGRNIAYMGFSGGPNLCLYDVVERDKRFVFRPGERNYSQIYWNMAWSPDSKRICYTAATRDKQYEVAIVNAAGTERNSKALQSWPVDGKPGHAIPAVAWHPDGKSIAFTQWHEERGRPQLFSTDTDSDEPPHAIPGQPENRTNSDPAWSPDGKYLVFASLK